MPASFWQILRDLFPAVVRAGGARLVMAETARFHSGMVRVRGAGLVLAEAARSHPGSG